MRYSITFLIATLVFTVYSCKEVGPIVNIAPDDTETFDTTYIASLEQPQSKKALIEKFTGVSCPNCPDAQKRIDGITNNYPDQVFTIAYHQENNINTKPIEGLTINDLRTLKANNIHDYLSNANDFQGLPKGGVNRIKSGDTHWVGRDAWSNLADKTLADPATINLHLTSSYDASNNKATILTKTAFLKEANTKQAITVILTEDNIIDAQENVFVIDTFYVHNDICRDVITSHSGDPILDDIELKEQGRVYEKSYTFEVDKKVKIENCYIVAFVHNNEIDNKEILQVAKIKLVN